MISDGRVESSASSASERMESLRRRLGISGGRFGGFATVSGVLTTRPAMIREADRRLHRLVMITTKSYQLLPNHGNREPILVEGAPGSYGNAVGLKNPGMEEGVRELRQLRRLYGMRALLNVSLSGSSPEEFVRLAEEFSEVADTLELNFSCPHSEPGFGMSIGVEPGLVAHYIEEMRAVTDLPLLPKLTPNVEDIGAVARAAVEAGADGIVAVNTVGPELYIEPHSGSPVLINNRGGRGGKSGRWIRETALEKVARIRETVGEHIPVIGIGGVEDAKSAASMRKAGADVIGIGSAFATVRPEDWERWFEEMWLGASEAADEGVAVPAAYVPGFAGAGLHGAQQDEHSGQPERERSTASGPAADYRIEGRQMEYLPYPVSSVDRGPDGMYRITLQGSLDFEPGQFVFLWLPGVGEKPFSVALSDPLTFLIRPRGRISEALCSHAPGDTLYVRGVYGRGARLSDASDAWIVAGGTGLAVAPPLAQALREAGQRLTTVMAVADDDCDLSGGDGGEAEDRALFREELSSLGEYRVIRDMGEQGRAVRVFAEELSSRDRPEDQALYVIGPLPFMHAVAEVGRRAGIDPARIQINIETKTRCGVGICGECACAGRLTCREGTFFSLEELDERGIDLSETGQDFGRLHADDGTLSLVRPSYAAAVEFDGSAQVSYTSL